MSAMEIDVDQLDAETIKRIEALGFISISSDAAQFIEATNTDLHNLFERYVKGDYGDNKNIDAFSNDYSMFAKHGIVIAMYNMWGYTVSIKTVFCAPVTHIDVKEQSDEDLHNL